jgi:hypothetical protein
VSLNKPNPERILAAANVELDVIRKCLVACQNRLYRETGTYPEELGAALQRTEFLLYGIMAGLITPVAKKEITVARVAAKPVRIQ